MSDIETMRDALRDFSKQRDWDQFHTPKNLIIALTAEVGELAEHFQWKNPREIEEASKNPDEKNMISDEIADVLSYLLRLSDKLDIDISDAFWKKIKKNAAKYPVEASKGRSTKYDKL